MNQSTKPPEEQGEVVGDQVDVREGDGREDIRRPCSSVAKESSRAEEHAEVDNHILGSGDAAETLGQEPPRSCAKAKAPPKLAAQEQSTPRSQRSGSLKSDAPARAALLVEVHFSELGRRLL